MADPFVETIRAGIGGFSEAISLAEDLEGAVQQVSDLGKKELAARAAWRRRKAQVNGDYAFLDAVEEYKRVREAMDMKAQIKAQVLEKWGMEAWFKIEEIERRQKEEFAKLYTEDGHDRKAMFQFKLACFSAALIIVLLMWATGVIRELSIAFYGD
jgi:hypothetical protein